MSLRHGRASRGIEMRLYGFGRYSSETAIGDDDLPFGELAQGLALPSGYHLCAMTNCSMPIDIFFTTDAVKKLAKILARVQLSVALACSRHNNCLDINGLDSRQGAARVAPAAPDIRRISKRGAVAPHIACGSLEDFSPVSSSGSEDASPRLRAFALRASGSPAIRSRPATSRSRSRRGCAGPSG